MQIYVNALVFNIAFESGNAEHKKFSTIVKDNFFSPIKGQEG